MKFLKSILIAFVCVCRTWTVAADEEVQGTVKSVQVKDRTMIVIADDGERQFDILKKAQILVNGELAELSALRKGQNVTLQFNSDLEIVTRIDAEGEGTISLEPELVGLTELPSDRSQNAPWLSSDGLTLYFVSKGQQEKQPWVWCAERPNPEALFENIQKVIPGVDPTVTDDGLELIVLSDKMLQVATRLSTQEKFRRPRKIKEFAGLGFLAAPCFSGDGLTLYAERFEGETHEFVKFTRSSRESTWSAPETVTLTGTANPNVRFLFVTHDGSRAFASIPDRLKDPNSNNLVMFSSLDGGLTFDSPGFIELEGAVIQGGFPRYIEQTNELYFANTKDGRSSISVIRNFDPESVSVE